MLFVVPALALSHRDGFTLATIWHLSVATTVAQAAVSGLLVRWQMNRRLGAPGSPSVQVAPA